MWRLSSYSLKPELSHTLRALPARLDEDGLSSPFHHPPSTSILWLGVTQPREQAREEAGQAHLHPHLGFLARGQWQPVSHLKEVPGPKQEVALLVEPSSPNRSSPGQVLMKEDSPQADPDEGREADWDKATPIQILPETQMQHPLSALGNPSQRAPLLGDLRYTTVPL